MWLTAPNRLGIAAWQVGEAVWLIEARSAEHGIQLRSADGGLCIASSDQRSLPPIEEQFVRGDELHLHYPQAGDNEFGFRLVVRPVQEFSFQLDSQRVVFELIVSVQTTLLDCHPTLDLTVAGSGGLPLAVDLGRNVGYRFDTEAGDVVTILGPHDAPFTGVVNAGDQLKLRLFGEFLEKGVIRRARPWIGLGRGLNRFSERDALEISNRLSASPLPLT